MASATATRQRNVSRVISISFPFLQKRRGVSQLPGVLLPRKAGPPPRTDYSPMAAPPMIVPMIFVKNGNSIVARFASDTSASVSATNFR